MIRRTERFNGSAGPCVEKIFSTELMQFRFSKDNSVNWKCKLLTLSVDQKKIEE